MHPLLIATILVLSLGSSGYAKETLSDSSIDHDSSQEATSVLSRAKRGNGFRRWNRQLEMLRLGKRNGAVVFDDDVDIDHKPIYSERNLYGLVDDNLGRPYALIPDGYAPSSSVDFSDPDDDFSLKSTNELRNGKHFSIMGDETKGDEYDKRNLNMLRLGKRQLGMLRLGKRDSGNDEPTLADLRDFGAEGEDPAYDKRTLNMLRLGKRHMQMLRLGKRHMQMLRLGKRHMQMLRLGKREDDVDTHSALGKLQLDSNYDKRNLNMLRLGKRDSDNKDTGNM